MEASRLQGISAGSHLWKGEGPLGSPEQGATGRGTVTETDTEHTPGLGPLPVVCRPERLPRESPLVTAEEVRVRPLRGLRDSRTLSSRRCLAFSDGNVALLLSTTLN